MSDEQPSVERVEEVLDRLAEEHHERQLIEVMSRLDADERVKLAAQIAINLRVQHPTERMQLFSDLMDAVQRLSRDQLVHLIAYAQDLPH